MTGRELWREVYERFDPEDPASRPDWRADRKYAPTGDILAALRRPFGSKRFLFYGTIGTGKTTELLHVGAQRTQESFVVFLDLWSHFSERMGDPHALSHIQSGEVVFLVGVAVVAAAQERFGHHWDAEELSELRAAAAAFLGAEGGSTPEIDVAKLASSIAVLAGGALGGAPAATAANTVLTALGTSIGAARWSIPLGRRTRVDDQDERASRLLDAVNTVLRRVEADYRPLTVLIDGLDRLDDRPESALDVFVRSTLLGRLAAPTVVTGPLSLRQHGLAALVRGFEAFGLSNLPVVDPAAPGVAGSGADVCVDAFRRRVVDLGASTAISEARLRRLALYSGGVLRDFVRLVRLVAEQCWDRGLAEADDDAVSDAIDRRRRTVEEGIDRRDIETLAEVLADARHRLPEDDGVPRLLRNLWLLPYPNETVWWYPHPLLLLSVLTPRRAGGAGPGAGDADPA